MRYAFQTKIQPTSLVVSSVKGSRLVVYTTDKWIALNRLEINGTHMMCNTFGVAIPFEISKKNIQRAIHSVM